MTLFMFTFRGVARGGDMGECPPRHGLKKNFSPWITDRWLFCNWCHTPDVAKTKRKCAISTLIFRKFSWGIAPRLPYWGGATAPLPRHHPLGVPALRASAPRSGPSVPPSSCLIIWLDFVVTKILATRLFTFLKSYPFILVIIMDFFYQISETCFWRE